MLAAQQPWPCSRAERTASRTGAALRCDASTARSVAGLAARHLAGPARCLNSSRCADSLTKEQRSINFFPRDSRIICACPAAEGYSAAIRRCGPQQQHLAQALVELLTGVQEELKLHDSYAAVSPHCPSSRAVLSACSVLRVPSNDMRPDERSRPGWWVQRAARLHPPAWQAAGLSCSRAPCCGEPSGPEARPGPMCRELLPQPRSPQQRLRGLRCFVLLGHVGTHTHIRARACTHAHTRILPVAPAGVGRGPFTAPAAAACHPGVC